MKGTDPFKLKVYGKQIHYILQNTVQMKNQLEFICREKFSHGVWSFGHVAYLIYIVLFLFPRANFLVLWRLIYPLYNFNFYFVFIIKRYSKVSNKKPKVYIYYQKQNDDKFNIVYFIYFVKTQYFVLHPQDIIRSLILKFGEQCISINVVML